MTDEFGPQKFFDDWPGDDYVPSFKLDPNEKAAVAPASSESQKLFTEQAADLTDHPLVLISLLEGFVSLLKDSRDKERCRLLVASLKLLANLVPIKGYPPKLSDEYIRANFERTKLIDIADTFFHSCEAESSTYSDNVQRFAASQNYLLKFAQSVPTSGTSPSKQIVSELDAINFKLEQTWNDTSDSNSNKTNPLYGTEWNHLFGRVRDIRMARHVGLWIVAHIAPLPRGWQNSRYCLGEIMRLYYTYEGSKFKGMSDEWYSDVYLAIERMQLWSQVGLRRGAPKVSWPYFAESMTEEAFKEKLYQLELLDYPEALMQPDSDPGSHN